MARAYRAAPIYDAASGEWPVYRAGRELAVASLGFSGCQRLCRRQTWHRRSNPIGCAGPCGRRDPRELGGPRLHQDAPADNAPEGVVPGVAALHPLGRLGTATEVAELVCLLASSAASNMTGGST